MYARMHRPYIYSWFDIGWKMPGRTPKDVRNQWRSHLISRLLAQGIDSRTQKPLAEAGSSSTVTADNDGDWKMVPLPLPPAQPRSPSSAAPGAGDEDVDNKRSSCVISSIFGLCNNKYNSVILEYLLDRLPQFA
jgi:hypothetical protein